MEGGSVCRTSSGSLFGRHDLQGERIGRHSFTGYLLRQGLASFFRVEKVLKRTKDKLCVKWKGYPAKYNSWIHKNDVK